MALGLAGCGRHARVGGLSAVGWRLVPPRPRPRARLKHKSKQAPMQPLRCLAVRQFRQCKG